MSQYVVKCVECMESWEGKLYSITETHLYDDIRDASSRYDANVHSLDNNKYNLLGGKTTIVWCDDGIFKEIARFELDIETDFNIYLLY